MNKNHLTLLAALALVGCKDKGDSGDVNDTSCTVETKAEYPIDGQPDAYYRANVEFSLSEADTSASISLADASGAAVSGTSSLNDDSDYVTFSPDAPLAPSTSYTATISSCDGETASITFTTSALGTAMSEDPTGKTYVVDLAGGRFVKPAGVGDLIGGLLENAILIGVVSADTELEIRGAISSDESTEQDTCTPSLDDFPNADFSQAPYFEIPEGDVAISVAGFTVEINSMSISGSFAADATYFGGGTVSGELDARDLGPLLKGQVDDTSPEYLCSLLAGFGVSCVPCVSDNEPYCAELKVVDLVADEQSGELVQVELEDCHETCAASCDNKECADAATFPVCN